MATKSMTKTTAKTTETMEAANNTAVIVEPAVVEKAKKEFTDSDYVLCRSIWQGGLTITCSSGDYYEFSEYGSTCEIKYRDLVWLTRKHSDHVFLPRFIIMDDDFVEEFPQIKRLYEKMYTVNDLKEILDLPVNQMEVVINELPDAAKDTLRSLIATEIANGHLDSIRKVKVLSNIFDSDFNLLSELFVR